MRPIIDTHLHLWDLERFDLPWLASAPALDRCFLFPDYEEATRGLNIDRMVYMEVDVATAQQRKEAEYVLDLCRKPETKVCAAVIAGHPGTATFREHVSRFAGNPSLKGIRQVLHGAGTPRGHCLGDKFVSDIAWLGEKHLRFDLCLRPGELEDGVQLARQCPQTPLILDHCGNPSILERDNATWKKAIEAFAKLPNVTCKVSGLMESAPAEGWSVKDLAPFVRHVCDSFGPDRVLFASNWPVCNLSGSVRAWVDALESILSDRREEDLDKLFHDNAVEIYALSKDAPVP
ncbi:MAG: amidohydrolase family protein [Planctomycetota bacterium]